MGRYFALTLDFPKEPQAKTRPKTSGGVRFGNLGLWVLVFVAVLGISYLFAVNGSSTKGYEIKKLERRLLELKESSKRLELEAASLKSIQNLEATVKTLNLAPGSGSVKYLFSEQGGYAFDQ